MKKIYILLFFFSISIISCKERTKNNNNSNDSSNVHKDTILPSLVNSVDNIGYCIPSPFDISYHIQKLNLPFDKTLVNSLLSAENYESSFKKLLNLGVYGIDLSYLAIYNQTSDILNYSSQIKFLANQTNLSYVFTQESIEIIEQNIENQDTLIKILTDHYKKSDEFLKQENLKMEAVLVLCGCWVESLYILTKLEAEQPNKKTIKKIAEHKFSAEAILGILRPYYKTSSEITKLIDYIVDLCYEFDGIDYNYTYVKPTTNAATHTTTINSTSEFKIESKHIELISNKIDIIRNYIIK